MAEQPTDAELAQLGIYDPDAPDAAERLEFVRYALAAGATPDELTGPLDEISADLWKRQLRGRVLYTVAQAAERAGLTEEDLRTIGRASGLADPGPGEAAFTEDDVSMLQTLAAGRAFFGDELIMQLVRVTGAAMSRVADSIVSAFAVSLATQASEMPLTQAYVAQANEVAISLLPSYIETMGNLLRRHIVGKSRSELFPIDDATDKLERGVGFCDLVGYTSFSGTLAAADLSIAVGTFGARSSDLITEHGGSVVKLIGDEVMFVAPDAPTACRIGVALSDGFTADPLLPEVRVGLAHGLCILREGDYYGPVVNLAARIVRSSAPGQVLAPSSFRGADGFTFDDAGAETLKGFDEPIELVSVRRA